MGVGSIGKISHIQGTVLVFIGKEINRTHTVFADSLAYRYLHLQIKNSQIF